MIYDTKCISIIFFYTQGGRECMVVGFTTIYAISAYHTKVMSLNLVHGEVYSIQHYVIKFVRDLQQFGGYEFNKFCNSRENNLASFLLSPIVKYILRLMWLEF